MNETDHGCVERETPAHEAVKLTTLMLIAHIQSLCARK